MQTTDNAPDSDAAAESEAGRPVTDLVVTDEALEDAAIEDDELVVLLPGAIESPPDQAVHPVGAYLARLARSSRRTQEGALHAVAQLLTNGRADAWRLPWHRLRRPHLLTLHALLREPRPGLPLTPTQQDGERAARAMPTARPPYAPATANRMLVALRGVLKECWRAGLLPEEDYRRLVDDLPAIKGSRPPKGRALEQPEVLALLEVCGADPRPGGVRDGAIIALLVSTGLRRAELVALQRGDLDRRATTLTVRGKGDRVREAPVPSAARAWLMRWLALRGDQAGPLFHPIAHHDHLQHDRALHPASLPRLLERRVRAAALASAMPHDFRRTFITSLLDAGTDTLLAQRLAGHASPTTTARYDRRTAAAARQAAEHLPVPLPPIVPD